MEQKTAGWFWEQALAYYDQHPDALDQSLRHGFTFTFLTLGGLQHLLRIHQGHMQNEKTWSIPEQKLSKVAGLLPVYWSLIPQETPANGTYTYFHPASVRILTKRKRAVT